MLIRHTPRIHPSEITPRDVWMNRRALLAGAGAAGLGLAAGMPALAEDGRGAKLDYTPWPGEPPAPLTPYDAVTSYNNFYEFGPDKSDPKAHAGGLTTRPWSVVVDGLCDRPGTYDLDDVVPATLEERIYRFRCVEAWAMVVPWVGFPLADLLRRVEPLGSARYVAFETLVRPDEMRAQRGPGFIDWPYREGLRLDEAMHPLTILATGLYGEELPNQNGAPLRLVVPWKYGFKSIKSIVRVTLTEEEPYTTWNALAPREYGFYANVNPEVDHPRWSQSSERVVGAGLFARRQDTLMFNGYADEVAKLYDGMDLAKFY